MADSPVATPVGLVSAASNGVEGDGASASASFSPNGSQVVFVSSATNLVAGDTDAVQDVFAKSLTGAIRLVSYDSVTGVKGDGASYQPVFSPDGTKIAFSSLSTNFAAADNNGPYGYDIFVKDLSTGRVTLASAAADGTPGDDVSLMPVFSPDSTKVSFYSAAKNLAPSDPANSGDFFIKDLTTGAVTLVSVNAAGVHGVSSGLGASFSPDGSKVAFSSGVAFTADDTNNRNDIFVKDLTNGSVTLVSRNAQGVEGNNSSFSTPVFSRDGTKIAFGSTATNLTGAGTAAGTSLFVKDLMTGAVTLVSTNAAGVQANGTSFDPSFSPDGTKILFDSYATNLVSGDVNGKPDIFVKDLTTGAVTLISVNAAGMEGDAFSRYAAFSPDGSKVTWESDATNLVPGDTNRASDVFVARFPSSSSATTLVSSNAAGVEGNNTSTSSSLVGRFTSDGATTIFTSVADNLTSTPTNQSYQLYSKVLGTGAISLVSATAAGVAANDSLTGGSIDGNGGLIAFTSAATNLDARAVDGSSHLYLKNTATGALTLVAPSGYTFHNAITGASEPAGNFAAVFSGALSTDGRYVVAETGAGPSAPAHAIVIFDTLTQAATDLTIGQAAGQRPVFSQDGGTVVFTSTGQYVSNDTDTGLDVYAYHSASNTFELASSAPGANGPDIKGNQFSLDATVSADGTRVEFTSGASNLDYRDTDTSSDIYVKDLSLDQLYLVDITQAGIKANGPSRFGSISADGTRVVFSSQATNLAPGATDGTAHIYLKDLNTGALTLLDTTASGAPGDVASIYPWFSPDGTKVGYESDADNLVANDTNQARDVFVTTLSAATPPATNTPPIIGGTQAGQADAAGVAISPFSAVTIADPDSGQTETVTVTLSAPNGAFTAAGFTGVGGTYTGGFSSAVATQTALRGASFTPVPDQSTTTGFTLTVSDGQATATNSATSVVSTYTPPPPPPTGGGGTVIATQPSVQSGLVTEFQNLERALAGGVDALTPGTPVYAAFQAYRAVAAQLDAGQVSLAQAEGALAHLVDATTGVAVTTYAFFTGTTPTAAGLNYLVHSEANPADLNDGYYQRLDTDNRYINFAVSLATGAGAPAFQAGYGGLSLSGATAKAYLTIFGAAADAAKVDAILTGLVPDGLGGQETRSTYFAQYGGDGPNGLGTKAAMVGFLLDTAVHGGSGVYGAADQHYLAALAHGVAPTFGSELASAYGPPPNLVGVSPIPDATVTV